MQVTYKCKTCENLISNEDSRNIMYEDLTGLSISEIISSTERKLSDFFEKCTRCNKKTVHEQFEKLLMLPEVLIVSLKRFRKSKSNRTIGKNCSEIEPSEILTIDETAYSLNAVVTHYGKKTNEGHYTTTLLRNGQWIDCNDEKIRLSISIPKM